MRAFMCDAEFTIQNVLMLETHKHFNVYLSQLASHD